MRSVFIRLLALGTTAVAFHAASAKEPLDPATVILEKGPVKVTARDFDAAMIRFPSELRDMARSQPDTILKVLDGVFVNRSLALKAIEAGLDKDPLIQQRLVQVRENFLATKYLEQLEAKVQIPSLEGRAEELYKSDPKQFTVPGTVTLRYVQVSHMNRTPEMALARAKEARAKLVAGAPLAQVSQEYSDVAESVRKTGELGQLRRSAVIPPIADYAFTAPLNQWSEPIVTNTATHLAMVVARVPDSVPPFAEVKGAILDQEIARLRKNVTERPVTEVRKDPANKIYPNLVEALKSDFNPDKLDVAQREAIRQLQEQH